MRILNTRRRPSTEPSEMGGNAIDDLRSALSAIEKQVCGWKLVPNTLSMFERVRADIEAEEDAKIFALLDAAAQPAKEG